MKRVRRLLACILAASMLIGANGVSYAAETADGGSTEAVEESVTEIRSEDTEDSSSDASGEFADAEENENEEGDISENEQSSQNDAADTSSEENTEDPSDGMTEDNADAEESGGNTPESQESEDASAAGTTAEIAAEVEPGSTSVITAVAVDQNGEVIKGYETVSLPAFDTQLNLADPSAAPVAIKGYEYVGAKIDDRAVNAAVIRTAEDGSGELCFLTDTEEIKATEQTVLTLCYKWIDVKRVYTYEDSKVKVTATLQYADAVPDDAVFKVTEITPDTKGYSYDTYWNLSIKRQPRKDPGISTMR